MTFLVVMMAFAVGILVGRLSNHWKRPGKPATDQFPSSEEHTYGHPWPPVSSLRKKLPTPPSGHVWEISVSTDERGSSILLLTLINVATGENVAARKRDLTIGTYGKTWAKEYRDYSMLKRDIFFNDLLGPLIDWANVTVNKVANIGQTTDYRIG